MNQSKLTYQEIIDKLKATGMTVDNFAHDEEVPCEYNELDDKAQEALDNYRKENPSPPYNSLGYKEYQDFIRNNYPSKWYSARIRWMKENNILWEEIHRQGGEDEGSHWESVKYFPDHDIYIKVTGYYQSYSGTEFYGDYKDCCSEVRPKEKLIIVYES